MSYTPGPWRIGDAGHTVFGPPNGSPSPKIVASVAVCNAHLIAAAPELLEACKVLLKAADELMRLAQQHDPETGYYRPVNPYNVLNLLQTEPVCIHAREAVAKAEGR